MRTIEITIDPTGQATVQTRRFTGPECRQASKFIEQALGQQIGERLTSESLLVLRNFHRSLGAVDVVQALDSAIAAGKQARTILVLLEPVVKVPAELERQFVVLEHELPDREQLAQIARSIATEPGELPGGEDLDAVLDSAAGLTRMEAENAFSLSLVRHSRIVPAVLWELNAQALKKSGLLTVHRGGEAFADLGGLDALKSFCRRSRARARFARRSRTRWAVRR